MPVFYVVDPLGEHHGPFATVRSAKRAISEAGGDPDSDFYKIETVLLAKGLNQPDRSWCGPTGCMIIGSILTFATFVASAALNH